MSGGLLQALVQVPGRVYARQIQIMAGLIIHNFIMLFKIQVWAGQWICERVVVNLNLCILGAK